jgi:general stress protein 26
MPIPGSSVARLNELIANIEIAMLTTIRADGTLHSCPMVTSAVDPNEILWFLSDTHTEKVEALRTERRVNVSYADPATERYVSVTGICQLVRDHEQTKALWNPPYTTWFPKGPDDPDLILLKVHVLEAEYWYAEESRMVSLGFSKDKTARYAPASHDAVAFPEDLNR